MLYNIKEKKSRRMDSTIFFSRLAEESTREKSNIVEEEEKERETRVTKLITVNMIYQRLRFVDSLYP
jgi:hypothetical protein